VRANTLVLAVAAVAAVGVASGIASLWLPLVPSQRGKLARLRERDRQLQEGVAQRASQEACRRIEEGVAEGRLSFAEGVAGLRAANASRPGWGRIRLDGYPGATEDERLCRHLLRRVASHLDGDPRRQTTLAALERQFKERLALRLTTAVDGLDLPDRTAGCRRRSR
jgi:hypothetical protein